MPQLTSIVFRPSEAVVPEGGYARIPLTTANLVAGHGIEKDVKGGSGKRQLNVMCAETVALLADEGFTAGPGQLGEQLIVSGLDVDALEPGARLRIGSEAIIEKVEPRTGCSKFEKYQGKLRQEAAGRLGIIARVIVGGAITVGDDVSVV